MTGNVNRRILHLPLLKEVQLSRYLWKFIKHWLKNPSKYTVSVFLSCCFPRWNIQIWVHIWHINQLKVPRDHTIFNWSTQEKVDVQRTLLHRKDTVWKHNVLLKNVIIHTGLLRAAILAQSILLYSFITNDRELVNCCFIPYVTVKRRKKNATLTFEDFQYSSDFFVKELSNHLSTKMWEVH